MSDTCPDCERTLDKCQHLGACISCGESVCGSATAVYDGVRHKDCSDAGDAVKKWRERAEKAEVFTRYLLTLDDPHLECSCSDCEKFRGMREQAKAALEGSE